MKFQNYSELERISAGANATVFKATHLLLNRDAAIKVYDITRPNDRRDKILQGLLESQKIAQAKTPQVIDIYDAGINEDKYYIIMEYFDSSTLRKWLLENPTLASRAHLCRHILFQVFALAEVGLFHGDFHLENVLVGKYPIADKPFWVRGLSECPEYRIIDFGTSHFSGEVFSRKRHWNVFHATFKSLLIPFDIDILHPHPKPKNNELHELFEWYNAFIATIPWYLSRLGRLHPLGYGKPPFSVASKMDEVKELLAKDNIFQKESYMGNDHDWGTFDYLKYQALSEFLK